MKIQYQTIGIIHSPFDQTDGMPIQPSRAKGVKGSVEVNPEYVEALADLDGFSHIILLYHFHRARAHSLKVIPFLDDEPRGLFSTRAPSRPNPIGLSLVRLLKIDGGTLLIANVDILEGTPVLDIKPYVSEFDESTEARFGWLEKARQRNREADNRFE